MQHVFKLAALAALCASAAAHAGVGFDANLETNTDFHKETATQDSVTNGGRVEINAAAEARNGDYFVKSRGTMLVGLSGDGVSIDDAWVQAGSSFADLAGQMSGPLIYSISADPVAAAKVINDFAKTNDKLVVKAGSYAGKVLDKSGVQALASIPSREELLSKLLGVMKAPVSGFAVALGALAKQREEAAA